MKKYLETTALVRFVLASSVLLSTVAYANPQDGVVAEGAATFSATDKKLDIHQSTDKVVIDWRSFDIAPDEHTQFHQPSASSMALNRINSGDATQILGKLTANGNILILNQSGVIFGKDAQVDVNGLIATTSTISNTNFMQGGQLNFTAPANKSGAIINNGTITAKDAGLVGLVAPQVNNNGTITAKLGKVHLASGDQFSLDMYGDGLMNIAASDDIQQQLISNKGNIHADGGTIVLSAASGGQIVNSLVTIEGELRAANVAEKNGKIIISGDVISHTGKMDVSGTNAGSIALSGKKIMNQGTLKANSTAAKGGSIDIAFEERYLDSEAADISATSTSHDGGTIAVKGANQSRTFVSGSYDASSAATKGGTVQMTAANGDLKLFGARINADGATGGGKIHIGGEYQGKGTLAHTATTGINYATTLSANATNTGDGGEVIVWSDELTRFGGKALARGGNISGNGGLIELSSKNELLIAGNAITSASAVNGQAGQLLLDPKNITIANGGIAGGISSFEFIDPNVDTGSFGVNGRARLLGNGNVLVSDMDDDFVAANTGAVYLFNGATGALISTLTGSTAGDQVGEQLYVLSNNNFVIGSYQWDNGVTTNAGAATWGSGTTGVSGVVSAANSLVGSSTNDNVGNYGIETLSNGNYVVNTYLWNNGGINDAGASTWANGTTGINGAISSANSLVGSTAGDWIGFYGLTNLTNGNYVLSNGGWDNGVVGNAGAVTWVDGTVGITGIINAANSLVGTQASDLFLADVTALTNGNYIVSSQDWDNGGISNVGAATWADGTTGIVGTISSMNSLVGSTAGDTVGSVTALSNGNYIVSSAFWNNGVTADVGAVTWGNGTTGITGAVSAANSMIGSTANDRVGIYAYALTNGNYVAMNNYWTNGVISEAGAATWGNGTTGTTGVVSAANSLVGSATGDLSNASAVALANGNYIIKASEWDNGAVVDAGAVAWGNGTTGTSGVITAANSLVGSTAMDMVGSNGITALAGGNYLVSSGIWDNAAVVDAGAVTWGNGTTGISGVISAANSLVGSTAGDSIGDFSGSNYANDTYSGVTQLTNGNYVVVNPYWDNGGIVDAGAVTWGNAATGVSGTISAANSLVGSSAGDKLGAGNGDNGVSALSNGHYVVASTAWDNGGTADVGAVTWADGTTGLTGIITAANSLVGSTAGDSIGEAVYLRGSDYVVFSSQTDNSGKIDAGAITFGNGSGGTVGALTNANSFLSMADNSGLEWYNRMIDTVNNRVIAIFSQAVISISPGGSLGAYDSYGDMDGSTVTLTPGFLTAILNAGTSVTLQANNDITVSDAILVNNAGGNGGTLTLQAGRSILVNDDITTDNGNLNLFANERLATGVVDAHRDAGAAVISMGAGAAIDAGTGNVVIRLDDGLGKTNSAAGNISLRDITANTILARNNNAGSDIVLASGALTTSATTGDSIILSSLRNFVNNAGAGSLNLAGTARWLLYSTNPADDVVGGLTANFTRFSCTFGGACPALGTGNGLLYSMSDPSAPTSSSTPQVVPSTVLYVSQTPITDIFESMTQENMSTDEPLHYSMSLGGADFSLGSRREDGSYSIFNGWITIDPQLVRLLGLSERKV